MLWCLYLPGKTGLKDPGNQAIRSLKKGVCKNVPSPWIALSIAIFGSEWGLFCLWVGLPHFSRPSLSPALSKKLSWVPTDSLTSPWPLLFLSSRYLKNLLIWQVSWPKRSIPLIQYLCAKHCAEFFAVIIPSNSLPPGKYCYAYFIGKETQVTLHYYICC